MFAAKVGYFSIIMDMNSRFWFTTTQIYTEVKICMQDITDTTANQFLNLNFGS